MPNAELRAHPDDPGREVADLPSACVQAHAANLMVLHDGTLACVWFGGSMEGRADISVYMARLDREARRWSEPVQLSNDAERSEQNPILFPVPGGPLWLLHTAQLSGNQDTAIVRRRVSHDNGISWGDTETLKDAPAGTFVRQPIHVHTDGSWLLPIFDCRVVPGEKWDGSLDESAVLRSTDQGASWQRVPVPGSIGCVHMSIVPAAGNRLLGFFRSRWADSIYMTSSDDGGLAWRKPAPTVLPNNNSSVQALRLADGRLAMIFNASSAADATERRASLYDELEDQAAPAGEAAAQPAQPPERRAFWGAPRAPMTLALSEDDGQTWPWQRNLEVGDGYCMSNDSARGINREYSYPSLRQTADGALHVAYTVFRKHIRHARVMPQWITEASDK
jgi:predicted neuraminidase